MSLTDRQVDELIRDIINNDGVRAEHAKARLLTEADGSEWGRARLELAKYELGVVHFQEAATLAEVILAAPQSRATCRVRGVAGIILCDARECLGQDVDVHLLNESIDICKDNSELAWAAGGAMIFSRIQFVEGDRSASKATLRVAAALYDDGGSPLGGPEALLRLAKLNLEDQDYAEARRAIDDALALLEKIPLRMTGSRILQKRLLALRATIPHD